ncbi:unnamed protein product [Closterium sp. Naga37s-1]|nr:unnamed protein product [Closterium sp. Naga37s-1]
MNMGRCLLDALNSSVLQEAREVRLGAEGGEGGGGRGVGDGIAGALRRELGRVSASSGGRGSSSSGGGSENEYGLEGVSGGVRLLVASLNAALVHNLSVAVTGNMSAVRVSVGHDVTHAAMGVKLPPINATSAASPAAAPAAPTSPGARTPDAGEATSATNSSSSNGASDTHVHIVRLMIDEKQNNSDNAGVDRAMVDIYTLALFSDALIISERAPPEPCLHFPPANERCPDGQAQVMEQVVAADPHVPLMHCVDVKRGITLKPLEGWESDS